MVCDIKVALSGFATLDYVAHAARRIVQEGTNPVALVPESWPRAGGAPLYAGKALVGSGCTVSLVVPIGRDQGGDIYAREARASGLLLSASTLNEGASTPTCVLIYQPSGEYCCFLDGGNIRDVVLSASQVAVITEADWVSITAGPPELSEKVLESMAPSQKLAWVVKADAGCFPDELACRLHARADVIFCNRNERDFLASSGSGPAQQIVFETDGERGVRIFHTGQSCWLPTEGLVTTDPTGAGDTFAGGALSVLIKDLSAVREAARTGLHAASQLLKIRSPMEVREPEVAEMPHE